jgi:hypothetical protein
MKNLSAETAQPVRHPDVVMSEMLRLSRLSWHAATSIIFEHAEKTADPVSRYHLRLVAQEIQAVARNVRFQFDQLDRKRWMAPDAAVTFNGPIHSLMARKQSQRIKLQSRSLDKVEHTAL